jgi:hypothetical protein
VWTHIAIEDALANITALGMEQLNESAPHSSACHIMNPDSGGQPWHSDRSAFRTIESGRGVLLYLNKTGPTKLDALCRRFDQREIGPLQNLALWKHIMVTIEDGTTTITAIGTELLKSRNEGRGDGHRRTRPNLQLYSAAKNDRVLHVRPFLQCVRVTHFWIATILYLICS